MKACTVVTDPGHDDLIALSVLKEAAFDPVHTLVSTFGNVKQLHTAQNAKEFIALAAPHWNLLNGSQHPLNGDGKSGAEYFHGADGVWGVHPHVDVSNVVEIKEAPKGQDLVSLGSMTDVWKIYQQNKPEEVMVMGGIFKGVGNEGVHAEFNIAMDADAAAKFFENCHDTKVQVVPLDATRKVFWTLEQTEKIPEDKEYTAWAKELIKVWFKNRPRIEDFILHDPLAMFLKYHPEHAVWVDSGIEVITEGEERGKTILSDKNPSCQIAMDIVDPQKTALAIYDLIFKK